MDLEFRFWDFSLFYFPHENIHSILNGMKHGFLLVDKPEGISSHDAVAQVRRALSERKVGHLGTLDPAASGLLVLAVGAKALKVIELFPELSKEYIADVHLGAVSSTYDREGVLEEVEPKPGWTVPEKIDVQRTLDDHFLGSIEQVPPAHSAVHVNGQRAYKMARQGQDVDMPTRNVRIDTCALLSYEFPDLSLKVACSTGTYIRSLAHDLGQKLRCGGYLSGLRRTKVGEWLADFAMPPEVVTWADIIPLKEVLASFGGIELTEEEATDLKHGRTIERQVKPDTIGWYDEKPLAILIPAKDGSRGARPRKVL